MGGASLSTGLATTGKFEVFGKYLKTLNFHDLKALPFLFESKTHLQNKNWKTVFSTKITSTVRCVFMKFYVFKKYKFNKWLFYAWRARCHDFDMRFYEILHVKISLL